MGNIQKKNVCLQIAISPVCCTAGTFPQESAGGPLRIPQHGKIFSCFWLVTCDSDTEVPSLTSPCRRHSCSGPRIFPKGCQLHNLFNLLTHSGTPRGCKEEERHRFQDCSLPLWTLSSRRLSLCPGKIKASFDPFKTYFPSTFSVSGTIPGTTDTSRDPSLAGLTVYWGDEQ